MVNVAGCAARASTPEVRAQKVLWLVGDVQRHRFEILEDGDVPVFVIALEAGGR